MAYRENDTSRPSIYFKALVTCSGELGPTMIISKNDLGETPVVSRNSTGDYQLETVAGLFDITTHVLVSLAIGATTPNIRASFADSDVISIKTCNVSDIATDLDGSFYLSIEV